MNFTLDLIILFEKLDKNIEIGNNEWHGAPFGEIETEPRNIRISKPLRWKHLELSEKKIKNQQGKKCQKYDYFVH
jgi:hypothetical protein